ncbi:MAG TPA: acetate/propionate family kinase [Candidatus Chromulinivoraceae bacterium]|nr:acetate/propionate family kinase [Candidatus Chromulinivoraceae bacterium]
MNRAYILTINAGSSSIKFALFSVEADEPTCIFDGAILSIGWPGARFMFEEKATGKKTDNPANAATFEAAVSTIVTWLHQHVAEDELRAIGHRIVHGGPYFYEATIVTDDVINSLTALTPFDPLHLPNEVALIKAMSREFTNVSQVACFDTAFHHDIPRTAQILPIPRKYLARGIRRYGFHGLSCEYIINELRKESSEVAHGRIIIAHLGNGASLTAVKNGKSVDTTMALTPAAGVPMSTRSGDIDPGIVRYLAESEGQTAHDFDNMVNNESGLLGISETTSDMEEILKREDEDARAKEAADVFCYQIKKSIGALAATMGGLDTIVFSGGMGENAPKIRARVCDGLDFLGIHVDQAKNEAAESNIAATEGQVAIRILHTDESVTIVRQSWKCLQKGEQ